MVALVAIDFATLGRSADDALGPPGVRMHARFAKGGPPAGAHPKAPLGMLPRIVSHLAGGFLKGKAQPSPFFDPRGQPRVKPTLIDKAERESLRARVLADAQA